MAAEDYDKDGLASWVRMMKGVVLDEGVPLVGSPIAIQTPLCPLYLGDVFGAVANAGRPEALLMGAMQYADMRMFGRDVMEIETFGWVIKAGVQARLHGCPVIAGFGELRGASVWVVGTGADGWVKQEGRVSQAARDRRPGT